MILIPLPARGRSGGGRFLLGKFGRTRAKTIRAQRLRRDMTDAEKKLWPILRAKQFELTSFRRQHPIGDYILDFYAPALKLAIECDGGQHAELTKNRDQARTAILNAAGILVLRFWNNDVLENLEGVAQEIRRAIGERKRPLPTPPLSGEGIKG